MPTSSSVSASSIVAGTLCGYHTLKIVGYSHTKDVPNGKWIDSCPFRVGGRTWHVRYYPNGEDSKNIDCISFFLKLDGTLAEGETVKAGFKFSLLDQDGEPVPSYTTSAETRDFSVHPKTWGFNSQCRALENTPIVVPPSDMHRDFGDLLSSKAIVDVEFLVGGETFSAHRSVLAARSPVFRAEFLSPMKESTATGPIRIDDMEAQVFKALLTFMYTDALPDMDQQEEYAMTQHLLIAADRYGLDRLKLICEDKLSSGIGTSSVAAILALADQHNCSELKEACLAFLREPTNLDEAIESQGFELLTKTSPGVIKELLKSQVIPSSLGKRKSRA
ncbi:hypothetical protein QYE76_062040 [Lolium multiflorum]|uniref:Uncharacterized protein n=1 Tax=Lolium multiflorum TaxID=4521 RepID=A0AAD8S4H8_LOLMU|nr:hypothetical protein QYE76_062040 [Lolium multiflorum]